MLRTSWPGPEDVVRDYYTALAAHDTSRLPSHLCRDNPLCQNGALDRGYQPPQQVTVSDAVGNDDNRSVPVTYTLAGQHLTATVPVNSMTAGSFGARAWSITEPPGSRIIIPGHTPAPITVAAARIGANLDGQDIPVWAPPGVYTLTRPATPLLEPAETTLTITDQPTTPAVLPATIREPVTGQAQHLVRDRLDQCAAEHTFTPTVGTATSSWHSCPLTYDDKYSITDDPTWTITAYPQLHLDPADDGTITVTTTTPGTAHITFRWTLGVIEPRTWTDVTDTITITVEGRIVALNGALEWQPA